MVTALTQAVVYVATGSIALLADLIHNAGDALTAVPIGTAFLPRSVKAERRGGSGAGQASGGTPIRQRGPRRRRPARPCRWTGLEIGDPLIGLAITGVILRITWQSWITVRRAHAP